MSSNKINIKHLFCLITLLSFSFLNSSLHIRYVFIAFSIIFLIVLVYRTNRIIHVHTADSLKWYLPVILVLWSGITLVLSGYITTGFLRYGLLLYETIFTYFIIENCDDIDGLLYSYFSILVIINFLTFIFMRHISLYSYYTGETVFRGVYYEKNTLGTNLTLGIPMFVIYMQSNKNVIKKLISLILLVLAMYMIIISRSTSALLFMTVLLILVTFRTSKWKRRLSKVLYLLPAVIICFGVYLKNYQAIVSSSLNTWMVSVTGKGLDFSSRAELWFFSLRYFLNKPLTGYGYNGFWSDENRVRLTLKQYGYKAYGFHAHSGYIELLMATGIIGAVIMLIIIIICVKNICSKKVQNCLSDAEVLYTAFILFSNFFYNSLLDLGFMWAFIIIIYSKVIKVKTLPKPMIDTISGGNARE